MRSLCQRSISPGAADGVAKLSSGNRTTPVAHDPINDEMARILDFGDDVDKPEDGLPSEGDVVTNEGMNENL